MRRDRRWRNFRKNLGFQVDITEPALSDAEEYVRFIREIRMEPEAAGRWFRGLVRAIYSLEDLPERWPVIPEQPEFRFEMIYFSRRIIFSVEVGNKRVVAYRVYPGAKRALSEVDLQPEEDD